MFVTCHEWKNPTVQAVPQPCQKCVISPPPPHPLVYLKQSPPLPAILPLLFTCLPPMQLIGSGSWPGPCPRFLLAVFQSTVGEFWLLAKPEAVPATSLKQCGSEPWRKPRAIPDKCSTNQSRVREEGPGSASPHRTGAHESDTPFGGRENSHSGRAEAGHTHMYACTPQQTNPGGWSNGTIQ